MEWSSNCLCYMQCAGAHWFVFQYWTPHTVDYVIDHLSVNSNTLTVNLICRATIWLRLEEVEQSLEGVPTYIICLLPCLPHPYFGVDSTNSSVWCQLSLMQGSEYTMQYVYADRIEESSVHVPLYRNIIMSKWVLLTKQFNWNLLQVQFSLPLCDLMHIHFTTDSKLIWFQGSDDLEVRKIGYTTVYVL